MTAAEALVKATRALRDAGIDGAARDARLLLAHALDLPSERVGLHLEDHLSDKQLAVFDRGVATRLLRQPISQILGYRLFWGRRFRVTRDVLDPRPETETLVEAALQGTFQSVLDLGTGSGAILLTLLAERGDARGVGVDISESALAVAAETSVALGVSERSVLMRSDWFSAVDGTFDLIVSNPPYITAAEMQHLSPEVRNWEPHRALTPGEDGLGAYRSIAAGVMDRLRTGGRLIVEIGSTQAAAVTGLFAAAGLQRIDVTRDLDGRDRVVTAFRE